MLDKIINPISDCGSDTPIDSGPRANHVPPPFRALPRPPPRMNLVVVESPAKAKTINKYLGPD
ncbi:MAG: hypothetical protein ACXW3K_05560, partial [Brevundimonas sp.]